MPPTALAMRRIMRDVSQLETELLEAQGIYYVADEAQITRGTAMLVGGVGTPYAGGFYFFGVEFPDDYPFSPLRVVSLTQDGVTRFNPNMYLNGKVCLSILNTWHDGPQWTGVQTLQSVLLALMSAVLNENPLENEPAFRGCGASAESMTYNRMLMHANVYTAVLGQLRAPPAFAAPFIEIMRRIAAERRPELLTIIRKLSDEWDGKTEVLRVFSMQVRYNFAAAADALAGLALGA